MAEKDKVVVGWAATEVIGIVDPNGPAHAPALNKANANGDCLPVRRPGTSRYVSDFPPTIPEHPYIFLNNTSNPHVYLGNFPNTYCAGYIKDGSFYGVAGFRTVEEAKSAYARAYVDGTIDRYPNARNVGMWVPDDGVKQPDDGGSNLDQVKADRDRLQNSLSVYRQKLEILDSAIARLAEFIIQEVPGEPSESEGAVDCAIRIIRRLLNETDPGRHARELALSGTMSEGDNRQLADTAFADSLVERLNALIAEDPNAVMLLNYALTRNIEVSSAPGLRERVAHLLCTSPTGAVRVLDILTRLINTDPTKLSHIAIEHVGRTTNQAACFRGRRISAPLRESSGPPQPCSYREQEENISEERPMESKCEVVEAPCLGSVIVDRLNAMRASHIYLRWALDGFVTCRVSMPESVSKRHPALHPTLPSSVDTSLGFLEVLNGIICASPDTAAIKLALSYNDGVFNGYAFELVHYGKPDERLQVVSSLGGEALSAWLATLIAVRLNALCNDVHLKAVLQHFIEQRVHVSEDVANLPGLTVTENDELGLLGVLNGVISGLAPCKYRIAADYDDTGTLTRFRIIGFSVLPEPPKLEMVEEVSPNPPPDEKAAVAADWYPVAHKTATGTWHTSLPFDALKGVMAHGTTEEEAVGALVQRACMMARSGTFDPEQPNRTEFPAMQHILELLAAQLKERVGNRYDPWVPTAVENDIISCIAKAIRAIAHVV